MSSPGTSIRWGQATIVALAALLCLAFPAVAAAGSISGTVTAAVGGGGLEEVEVCAWSVFEEDFGCAATNLDGEYEIPNLDPDEYTVEFWDLEGEYAPQHYDHRSFYWEADPVLVGAGAVTGIDAGLVRGGLIQGTVRAASNGAPLEEVEVCAYELTAEAFRCTFPDAAGNYSFPQLVPGTYRVEFWSYDETFAAQFWNHKANWSEADPIPVAAGQAVGGINADLLGGPLPPPPVVTPPVATPPPLVTNPKPKVKRCKKGFRKKKVKGKVRCVKVRKHQKKNRGAKKGNRAAVVRFAR